MKDEIKEILDYLKFTNNDVMWCDKITLDVEQSHLLLDYITNLQQENERLINHNRWLEDKIETYLDNVNARNDLLIEELDYKSRCEKAIENIKESLDILKGDSDIPIATGNVRNRYLKPVLNILQNGSDEE